MYKDLISFVRSMYGEGFIPLHEPRFVGNEKKYVNDCIDSTFVSSVGQYVSRFEEMICECTGSAYAVAIVNGTAALHMALILADVKKQDEVLSQALTFVATANAISYLDAEPVFLDSDKDNLGMSPESLRQFLETNGEVRADGFTYNKTTGKRIKACVPMHVFGHPVKLDEILAICKKYNITVVEDAAESLGSFYKGKHTGTIAPIGTLSFNGNKTITCGGGGMLLIQDKELAARAKHLTTTAKTPHKWEFFHDEIAYNYRLPNLNAALACAQMEFLPKALESKRAVAKKYKEFFSRRNIQFVDEPENTISNFWLNTVVLDNPSVRDEFLKEMNEAQVMVRPIWKLMTDLPAFKHCQKTDLTNARFFEERVVNIPSSPLV